MAKRKRRRGGTAVLAPPSEPQVRPGLVGLGRPVPRSIPKPPYIPGGEPGPARAPLVRSAEEIALMRRAGTAAAEVLLIAGESVAPGVTTDEIDAVVHDATVARGAYPSPLGYRGFPKSTCTSVNEVICHGIPDSRPLADGDIVNVDVTVYLDGVHGDTNCTFLVGDVDQHSEHLVRETRQALYAGIAAVRQGAVLNEVGRAIEQHADANSLGVVREFIGHGIGTEFHGVIQVPHYYESRANLELLSGMSFTIEPMLNLGTADLYLWDDDWTAVTLDGRRSAQFEHTLIVTEAGSEVMTLTDSGACAADRYL
ncbi:MAG: type I methionyl aminopeptidase [Acidimicrobiia bacterium]|nr:type I methionyl aminopeptidase [Acidimicrobiia bacterium]MDH5236617.1 type I methionyl aminopeptidase [Acidimicrobiia bacterium]